ncbi:zinc-dependent alcohol dehydrogenase family protein [Dictyobacter formicarum]|uniref:Alcohol dehydrogenase n=1 Tax=Dictyobacter formicarum TaxID=2778368 RepID=A0ABQ3VEJ3_9CHLR|nr:zinc-dependent alcohol dehydrogenase family protein [Dictyobacter formicarum]GHO83808.1 alcohol dehydrogenase [Dictyobacter formicarum]
MRAAIIDRPGTIRVGERPDPTPGVDDLIIRVGACGICGTDLHISEGEFPPTPYPIVPGHEFAGEVVMVGSNIQQGKDPVTAKFRPGMRVAVDPSLFCGKCDFCRVGHGNLCQNWAAIGDTVDGAFAEYVKVPAANAYLLPDSISYREAALIEPISCAVHGIHRLNPRLGDKCLIVGAGTMGLLLLQLLLRGGASQVVVNDTNTQRLKRAEQLGAYRTGTDIAALLKDEPLGFDCVIDATGVSQAMEAAFNAVRRGGKFMVFGVAPQEARISLSPFRIYNDEITVLGSMAVLFSYGAAVDLMSSGAIDTKAMLTLALPLEDFPSALEKVRRGEGVKTQILPNGEI